MITIEELIKLGFVDKSSDKNGGAYRRDINSIFEICWFTAEKYLRFQSVGSGYTMELKGIKSIEDLGRFWYAINGELLT